MLVNEQDIPAFEQYGRRVAVALLREFSPSEVRPMLFQIFDERDNDKTAAELRRDARYYVSRLDSWHICREACQLAAAIEVLENCEATPQFALAISNYDRQGNSKCKS